MKKIFAAVLYFLCSIQFLSAQTVKETPFEIHKGINISAWLSQSGNPTYSQKEAYFTQKDLNELARLGFDHIRLPVDEMQMFDANGNKKPETFRIIKNLLGWCKTANVRVIFDCHALYASRSIKAKKGEISLWESEKAQNKFVQMWKTISSELKDYPNELLAYEILNEPVAPHPDQWNKLSNQVISELRKLEPSRVIFLGSNRSNSVTTFNLLKVPKNDPNIILTFHFYHPGILTHYNLKDYKGGISGSGIKLSYPGKLISDKEFLGLNPDEKKKLRVQQGTFDRQKLLHKMLMPIQVAKQNGLRVHCGEFGANFKYPNQEILVSWITDLVNIFKEQQIPYTVWGYRKQFGVFDDNRKIKNQKYLDAILK